MKKVGGHVGSRYRPEACQSLAKAAAAGGKPGWYRETITFAPEAQQLQGLFCFPGKEYLKCELSTSVM